MYLSSSTSYLSYALSENIHARDKDTDLKMTRSREVSNLKDAISLFSFGICPREKKLPQNELSFWLLPGFLD